MFADLVGRRLHDREGQPVGIVTAVYRYPAEVEASWGIAEVTRGRFFRTVRLVDLEHAIVDGSGVSVPYSRDRIGQAPAHLPLIGDTLSAQDAAEVRNHYCNQG